MKKKQKNRLIKYLGRTCACVLAASLSLTAFGCSESGTVAGTDENTVALPSPVAAYSFEQIENYTTYNAATGKYDKINYQFSPEKADILWTKPSDPLLKKGVVGNSLYMDGFSTCVQTSNFKTPDRAITLSAWVAPRVFENIDNYDGYASGQRRLTSVINEGNLEDGVGFALGYGRLGLWGFQLALTKGGERFVVGFYDPINALPLYEWSHITATYDGNTGYIALLYNGEKAYEDVIPELVGTSIVDSNRGNLYIGKYTAPAWNDEYNIGRQMPAGLLDEVYIYRDSLTPAQMRLLYHAGTQNGEHPALSYSDVGLDSTPYEGDRYRPQYHALPPAVWMNEPHSPFYYKGKYHVMYQCNPAGPYWSQIRWGHIVSDDMIHWKNVRDSVVPTAGICPEGVWTGGATIGPDGTPWLVITAGTNLYGIGNPSGQNIAFAHCVNPDDPDLAEWIVEDTLTITQPNDNSMGEREQFRDPYVWYDDETEQYFLIVCSSNVGAGGRANIYTSKNLHEWEYHGNLYECPYPEYDVAGEHWECIVLLPLTTKDGSQTKYILFDCPQYARGGAPEVECYYWIGRFDKENCRFIADSDEPRLFDQGAAIYTGQNGYSLRTETDIAAGKTYEQGRTILYSIAQGKAIGKWNLAAEGGWAHNFAIPLELWLSDNGSDVIREPIREIQSLYGKVEYNFESESGKTANEINEAIASVRGDTIKIDLKFTIAPLAEEYAARIGVRYNLTEASFGTERTFINFVNGVFQIDRLHSTLRQGCLTESMHSWSFGAVKDFEVTILLDRSMLEVFVNGAVSATERIYPMYGDSDYIRLIDENANMKVTKCVITQMKSAYSSNGSITPAYFGNTGNLADLA